MNHYQRKHRLLAPTRIMAGGFHIAKTACHLPCVRRFQLREVARTIPPPAATTQFVHLPSPAPRHLCRIVHGLDALLAPPSTRALRTLDNCVRSLRARGKPGAAQLESLHNSNALPRTRRLAAGMYKRCAIRPHLGRPRTAHSPSSARATQCANHAIVAP
jgi:hypothetical protein